MILLPILLVSLTQISAISFTSSSSSSYYYTTAILSAAVLGNNYAAADRFGNILKDKKKSDDAKIKATKEKITKEEKGEISNGDDTSVTDDSESADAATSSTTPLPEFEQILASNGGRIISSEELALHIEKEHRIWLSILGKVFDVTDGEEFYSFKKGSYKFYSGKDASPCFSSGTNTPDGANEKLEEWEDKKLMPVWEWSTFYEDHETYKYLGVLAGSRYYDEQGNETQLRKDIVHRSSEAKRISEEERAEKKKKRDADRMARKKQKEADMLQKRREAAEQKRREAAEAGTEL